ncbi:MAG: hypothetical protein MMC23_007761 [Stictis urceolatum]|nr:hypothetical protein [Stictis urceolata]
MERYLNAALSRSNFDSSRNLRLPADYYSRDLQPVLAVSGERDILHAIEEDQITKAVMSNRCNSAGMASPQLRRILRMATSNTMPHLEWPYADRFGSILESDHVSLDNAFAAVDHRRTQHSFAGEDTTAQSSTSNRRPLEDSFVLENLRAQLMASRSLAAERALRERELYQTLLTRKTRPDPALPSIETRQGYCDSSATAYSKAMLLGLLERCEASMSGSPDPLDVSSEQERFFLLAKLLEQQQEDSDTFDKQMTRERLLGM